MDLSARRRAIAQTLQAMKEGNVPPGNWLLRRAVASALQAMKAGLDGYMRLSMNQIASPMRHSTANIPAMMGTIDAAFGAMAASAHRRWF